MTFYGQFKKYQKSFFGIPFAAMHAAPLRFVTIKRSTMPTLQSIGVHPQLREKLLALEPAVETPQAFLSRDPTSLAKALDAPLQHIEKVRAAVADALAAKAPHGKRALRVAATVGNENEAQQQPIIVGAVSALDLCRYHEFLHPGDQPAGIATHSRRLDDLLAFPPEFKCSSIGGLPFGYVTQVSGPPASGKTQLALRLAAEHAARGGKVLFLASGYGHGTLLPLVRRLQHFCDKQNFQNILQNVTFVTVNNGHEALAAMEQVEETTRGLLILDSASGCLSADLYAAGDGDAGKALAQKVAYSLKRIARHNGAAVFVTNGTVSADVGVKAAMGQAWYAADISLWFQTLLGPETANKHILATLEYHPAKGCKQKAVEDRSVDIVISSAGITDNDEQQRNGQQ